MPNNRWNDFQQQHRGEGLSRAEMSSLYRQQSSSSSSGGGGGGSGSGRAPNQWNVYQHENAGAGWRREEMRQNYYQQQRQQQEQQERLAALERQAQQQRQREQQERAARQRQQQEQQERAARQRQQQEQERAARQRQQQEQQQKREQQAERERAARQRQQKDRQQQRPQAAATPTTTPRKANTWNDFLKKNGGKGLTQQELRAGYARQQAREAGLTKRDKRHPDHVTSADVRMNHRSAKYVQERGQLFSETKASDGTKRFYFADPDQGGKKVRISEDEYRARKQVGGHKFDCGIVAKILNRMPGPGLSAESLDTVRDIVNSDANFRKKSQDGNLKRDYRGAEVDFNAFFDGKLSAAQLKAKWTPNHTAKLKQYDSFLAKSRDTWEASGLKVGDYLGKFAGELHGVKPRSTPAGRAATAASASASASTGGDHWSVQASTRGGVRAFGGFAATAPTTGGRSTTTRSTTTVTTAARRDDAPFVVGPRSFSHRSSPSSSSSLARAQAQQEARCLATGQQRQDLDADFALALELQFCEEDNSSSNDNNSGGGSSPPPRYAADSHQNEWFLRQQARQEIFELRPDFF